MLGDAGRGAMQKVETKRERNCPIDMKTLEWWYLRIADHDLTWIGLNWLRPKKERRLGFLYILFSSVILGLPGVLVGIGMVFAFLGRVEPLFCLLLFLGTTVVELVLHMPFAHYWNKRAMALTKDQR
jgi:hypothetical protein